MSTGFARRARMAGAAVGAAGAIALLSAGAAQADVLSWGPSRLQPGFEQCVSLQAYEDARALGFADEPGVTWKVFRNGALIASSGSRETFFNEYFYGRGNYRFCAKNPQGLGVAVDNVSNILYTDLDATP